MAVVIGGTPTPEVDDAVCGALLALFLLSAAAHLAVLRANMRIGLKFAFSGMMCGLCALRCAALAVRVAWASYPGAPAVAAAAAVSAQLGTVLVFAVNLLLAQRVARAYHPRLARRPAAGAFFALLLAGVVLALVALIVGGALLAIPAKAEPGVDEADDGARTRRTAAVALELFGATCLAALAFTPIPVVLGSALAFRIACPRSNAAAAGAGAGADVDDKDRTGSNEEETQALSHPPSSLRSSSSYHQHHHHHQYQLQNQPQLQHEHGNQHRQQQQRRRRRQQRRHRVEKFGSGSWSTKLRLLLFCSAVATLGAAFRAGTAYVMLLTPGGGGGGGEGPAPWYAARWCYYAFNYATDLAVSTAYLASRFDRRFAVPDGAKGPRDYSSSSSPPSPRGGGATGSDPATRGPHRGSAAAFGSGSGPWHSRADSFLPPGADASSVSVSAAGPEPGFELVEMRLPVDRASRGDGGSGRSGGGGSSSSSSSSSSRPAAVDDVVDDVERGRGTGRKEPVAGPQVPEVRRRAHAAPEERNISRPASGTSADDDDDNDDNYRAAPRPPEEQYPGDDSSPPRAAAPATPPVPPAHHSLRPRYLLSHVTRPPPPPRRSPLPPRGNTTTRMRMRTLRAWGSAGTR
ncbi:hypothetical protein DL764_006908 [Monosporascus ibericus]|uniref:Uncharacterized protein n=1 Tax=Monosporascus ibericus TaxID=155417 RepID=A0A4Q4T3T7_9PEZI|nr:hypothetical protein DL764_006908 [Monosporascus ibericus]